MPVPPLQRPLGEVLDAAAGSLGEWRPWVEAWRESEAGRACVAAVQARQRAGATIFPGEVLRALTLTPLSSVRVVILGQDPYHRPGQAHGLAFSVPEGVAKPPSLRNIEAELQRDLDLPPPGHGSLEAWARRGVLLLNTSLTVEAGRPGSHAKLGWEVLTQSLLRSVVMRAPPTVFMLWGAHAQGQVQGWGAEAKGDALAEHAALASAWARHLALRANHPSPLAARRPPLPFMGCGHFGIAARWLAAQRPQDAPLDWRR